MRRPLLLPLVPLYAVGQALQNALRPAPKHLTRPVFSVGSLSAGGAGKTPVVQALANILQRLGHAPVVLSRGYGRGSRTVEKVNSTGVAHRFGDEPLQLARSGLSVYVAPDRHSAGLLAESEAGPHLPKLIHILDDGFQHRHLHRSLDLLLLTAADFQDHLLPAGNLRESLRAIRRADILLLRSPEAESLRPILTRHLGGSVKPILLLDRSLTLPWILPGQVEARADSATGSALSADQESSSGLHPAAPPARALAFCALARPDDFFADLRALSVPVGATISFPDHHAYSMADIGRLQAAAARISADAFLTTAKDAVKFTSSLRSALEQIAPIHTIPLTVTFQDETTLGSILERHQKNGG